MDIADALEVPLSMLLTFDPQMIEILRNDETK